MEKEFKFSGEIVRCTYDTEDYKIYAVDVSKEKYPEVKHNKFNNVTILGELPVLTVGVTYEIVGIEQESKYGYNYKVINIKREMPMNYDDMYLFLQEILTPNQARVLWENYPDIVQRVKENRLDDIDLSKLYGIKKYTFNCIKQKIIENFCLADLVIEFQGYLNLTMIKKIYNKYSSIEVLKKKLRNDPYKCLCGLAGVGFKTADTLLLEIEKASKENVAQGKEPIIDFDSDLKTSPQRCLSCLLYLLQENENDGHTKMNLANLRSQCLKLVPACADHFVTVIKNDSIYYNKHTLDVSLKSTYNTEKYIAYTIATVLKSEQIKWDYNIEKYRIIDGVTLSDEQMQAVSNVCNYNISILNGAGGCVDCDTEFFDGYKWKKISDYQKGDKVLQYEKDGTAKLVDPEEYHKKPCDKLWHFKKRGIDQCLSEEHRVVYQTSKGHLRIKPFKEVMQNHLNTGFRGKFYTTFNYSGIGINLSENVIRLMVAIFADGHFQNSGNHCVVNLKKQRKKDRLEYLLKINNIEYKKSKSSTEGYHKYWFDAPFNMKHYPSKWYQMNKNQLLFVLDEMKNWDGCVRKNNRLPDFTTTSKKDADFIQFAYSACGYRSTIYTYKRENRNSTEYIVSANKQTEISLNSDNRIGQKRTAIEEYVTKDGYKYCFTMPSTMWVARRNNCIFITGNTGKSFSTQAIIKMLNENNRSFALFAPTGKASKVLADYTKQPARTIHRGLGYIPINNWRMNKEHKLHYDIIVVDEFSMVDINLFSRLVDAIDFKYTKLLIIGDNAQLPSVSCGNLLHDFMTTKLIPTTTLTHVFRYGEGGLMKVATDVRFTKPYLNNTMKNKMTAFGDNKDYVYVDVPSDLVAKNAVALYKKLLEMGNSINNIQVLTAKNVGDCGTVVLNNMLQKVANPNYGSINCLSTNETTYFKGDLIIQKVNNYKAEIALEYQREHDMEDVFIDPKTGQATAFVANGETGIVEAIFDSYMIVDFDGIYVKYRKADLKMIGLGYCITIHKSQGSSIDNVILCTPQSHIFMMNSNLLYVGLTRMRKKCFHLGTLDSVNKAVKKKANLARNTFMQELLKEGVSNG